MKTRIYAVEVLLTNGEGALAVEKTYLVEATSQQAATRHVAKKYITAEAAKPQQVARLMSNGTKLEQALGDDVPPTQQALIPTGQAPETPPAP